MSSSFVRSSGTANASTRGVMQSRAVLSPSLMISWIISLSVSCSAPSSVLSSTRVSSSSSESRFPFLSRSGVIRSTVGEVLAAILIPVSLVILEKKKARWCGAP